MERDEKRFEYLSTLDFNSIRMCFEGELSGWIVTNDFIEFKRKGQRFESMKMLDEKKITEKPKQTKHTRSIQ